MTKYWNFLIILENNKQIKFDCIDQVAEFMLDTWQRGKTQVRLLQLDPNWNYGDKTSPAYKSVITLPTKEMHHRLKQQVNDLFSVRHSFDFKRDKIPSMNLKSGINTLRRYKELNCQ